MLAACAESNRGVLRSLIGMMHDIHRVTLAQRQVQRLRNPFSAQMVGPRPTHPLAAEGIQHDRQEHKTDPGGPGGDVCHPQPIRCVGIKVPLHPIRRQTGRGRSYRGGDPLAPAHAVQNRSLAMIARETRVGLSPQNLPRQKKSG